VRRADRILQLSNSHDGYKIVCLTDTKGNKKTKRVHMLVASAFIGDRPANTECGHLNAIRDDNRSENLRWITNQENVDQRKIDGNSAIGERCGLAKLTDEQVLWIRESRLQGKTIALMLGIARSNVSHIRSKKTWTHL
jgi:hypothetical protein